MVDFGKYLAEANRDLNIAPVKIAIIDDGINPTLNIFNDRVKRGESFHQLSENYNGRRGSFYVPSGPHGTLMAQLVCKVCPMVQLYIAQLEVFRGQQGQRSFRAESAADVSKTLHNAFHHRLGGIGQSRLPRTSSLGRHMGCQSRCRYHLHELVYQGG